MSKTREQVVGELIEKCLTELAVAHQEKYDVEKAERTAAMFLLTQMELSAFIEDNDLIARQAKNEVDRIEAEKYFEYKNEGGDKKSTDAYLKSMVAKDKDVVESKKFAAKAEASIKKWNYIMGTLKDGVYYFRSIGKKEWNQ